MTFNLAKISIPLASYAVTLTMFTTASVIASPATSAAQSSSVQGETLCTLASTPEQEAATKNYEEVRSEVISRWAQAIKSQLPAGASSFESVRTGVEELGSNEFDWDFAHGAVVDFDFYPATNAGTYTPSQQLPLDVNHAPATLR